MCSCGSTKHVDEECPHRELAMRLRPNAESDWDGVHFADADPYPDVQQSV